MTADNLELIAKAICAAEKFSFEGHAGSGAFKHTFRVQDGNRTLALKIYKQGQSIARAQREIDAMTRCDHRNIGKILRVDQFRESSGAFNFSLEEFLTGGSLSARLTTIGLYPADRVSSIATPLASAVAHLAALRLVHRDIKPDNVMLRQDGETPVLVDFGLVRDLSAISITPTWAMQGPGTPLFSSPEQLHNQKSMIDWRSDQFSLGVLLSFCVLGHHPYAEANDSPMDVVSKVADKAGGTERFRTAAAAAGLPALLRMTAPWPYQRFTRPEMLTAAWSKAAQDGCG